MFGVNAPHLSLSYCHNLSTHIAIPIPPPMHKAAMPRLAPVRFKPYNRVTRILHPDAPIGCPRARAPPLTFTFGKKKLTDVNIN